MLTILAIYTVLAFGGEWAKTFPVSSPPELRVEAKDASVSVTVWDRQEVSAHVNNVEARVVDNLTGNRLTLQVLTPKRGRVKLDLRVPREIGCGIKTGAGSIVIEGVRGRVVLATSTGGIEATGLDGKLEASTDEGKVRVQGRFDALNVRTGFGTIDATAAPGSKMFGSWRLNSDSGAIVLRLPSGFNADLDGETGAGRITVDAPVQFTATPDPAKLRGHLNGGGESLIIRTHAGNIKVTGEK